MRSIVALLALAVSSVVAKQYAPLPSADPFYRPPASVKASNPGDVLRSREVTVSANYTGGANVSSYQLLYRVSPSLVGSAEAARRLAPTASPSRP